MKLRNGLFCLLLLLSSPLHAKPFLERVGNLIDDIDRTISNTVRVIRGEPSEENQPEDEAAFNGTLPQGLPDDWYTGFIREPVFNSRILIVEAGTQHPRTVVLVHGLGQNGFRDWQTVIPALAEHYHVLAFDLPGFGYSENPGGRYSPSNYARVIDWLVEKNDRPDIFLVGHSMGGAIALRYAASYPERVDRLALVDVAGILERTAFVKHRAELPVDVRNTPPPLQRAAAQVKRWGNRLVEVASGVVDPTAVLRGSNLAWNALLTDRPNTNAALALIDEDFSGAIDSMAVPTLVIWGETDPVAPLRTGRLLSGRLSNASLQVIAGAAHMPMATHSDVFNEQLLAFLAGKTESRGAEEYGRNRGDLHCQGKTGLTYSGHYRQVTLENCLAITIDGLKAERLSLINSSVEIYDARIESSDVALSAKESVVTATNSYFSGRVGISSEDSRLDLAGVSVRGRHTAVEGTERSKFIFSVSDLHDDKYSGSVHGVFRFDQVSEDSQ